jgi:hypothetical protein
MLEPGETVELQTTWRNLNGSMLDLAGTLSFRLAPFTEGAAIADGAGAYGAVPDGAARACTDCYALHLDTLPGGRPPGHFDVPVVETLQPEVLMLRNRWRVHVGESFGDVPRNGTFYRAVETAVHNGVTAGCAAGAFCGTASVTREQAATFLLRGREGASYVPRRCTIPLFDDVPASSPFCPWVEELARRGATGGCTATSFCPAAAMTRAQAAVLVLRVLDPALGPPPCTTPMFADVPANDPFCRWIEELARRGVVGGCGGGNYCPSAAATREQMAAIVTAAFGLTLGPP